MRKREAENSKKNKSYMMDKILDDLYVPKKKNGGKISGFWTILLFREEQNT